MKHPHYETPRARQCDRALVFECRAAGTVCWIEAAGTQHAEEQFIARFGFWPEHVTRI